MANQPRKGWGTRSFYVRLATWERVKAIAAKRGTTASSLTAEALDKLVAEDEGEETP